MRQLDIERADLPMLLDRPQGLRGIELGVASGDFSARLWRTGAFAELWGVDAYGDHHDTGEYIAALRRVGLDANYRLLRMYFAEALALFPDGYFDFIYIDGYAHTGEEAGRTLYDWYAKLRVGGLMGGHDYHEDWPLVVASVDRFVADTGMAPMLTRLTSDPGPQDAYPSWAAIRSAAAPAAYPKDLGETAARLAKAVRARKRAQKRHRKIDPGAGVSAARSPLAPLRRRIARGGPRLSPAGRGPLKSLQGTRAGGRCLILGSAPSVAELDLSRIADCDVIALNRAADLCRGRDLPAKLLAVSDPALVADGFGDVPLAEFDQLFMSADLPAPDHPHLVRFDYYARPRIYHGLAQDDLGQPLFHCHTVAAFAIQIAVGMGYDEIFLAGIDLHFDEPEAHFYASSMRERIWTRNVSVPKSAGMRAGLAYLAHWAGERGVRLVNLSPRKSLPLIETADFDAVFPAPARKGPTA